MKRILISLLFLPLVASAQVDLTLLWDDVAGEDGYNVYRKLEKCDDPNPTAPWVNIGQTGVDVTTYTDLALAHGLKTCYRVTAFNEGGESAPSNEAGTVIKPGVPGNLRIVQ